MRRPRINVESTCCPFINRDDPRCASRFTLNRMHEAFGECLGAYHGCQTYHELQRRRLPSTVHVTINSAGGGIIHTRTIRAAG